MDYVMRQNPGIFGVAGFGPAVRLTSEEMSFPMPADLRSFGWPPENYLDGQVPGINLRQY